jgi:hypothetical protein
VMEPYKESESSGAGSTETVCPKCTKYMVSESCPCKSCGYLPPTTEVCGTCDGSGRAVDQELLIVGRSGTVPCPECKPQEG